MIEMSPAMLLIALLLACIAGGGLGMWLATVVGNKVTQQWPPQTDTEIQYQELFPIGGPVGEKPPTVVVIKDSDTYERAGRSWSPLSTEGGSSP